MAIIDELQKNYGVIKYFEDNGMPVPDDLLKKKEELEKLYLETIAPLLQDYAVGLFKELNCEISLLVTKDKEGVVSVGCFNENKVITEQTQMPTEVRFIKVLDIPLNWDLFTRFIKIKAPADKFVCQALNHMESQDFEEHVNITYQGIKEDVILRHSQLLTNEQKQAKLIWVSNKILGKLKTDFPRAYRELNALRVQGNLNMGLPLYLRRTLHLGYFSGTREFILCDKNELAKIERNTQEYFENMTRKAEEELVTVTQETLFKTYLKKNHYSDNAVKDFIEAIHFEIKEYIKKLINKDADDSIYSFETMEEVQNCVNILKRDIGFMRVSRDKGHVPENCLNRYLGFVISQNNHG